MAPDNGDQASRAMAQKEAPIADHRKILPYRLRKEEAKKETPKMNTCLNSWI